MGADFFDWLSKPEQKHLRGVNRVVLDYVLARVKPQNVIRTPQKDIAEALELTKSQVSAAFRAWREAGVFVEQSTDDEGDVLVFSPMAGFRGSGKGQSYALQRLARQGQVVLPFDEKRRQKLKALAEA